MSFDYDGDDYIESEARRQRRRRAIGVTTDVDGRG
ncbi:hypothetical protein PR002_g31473 [Phytophthora rubi]|uniref:Uncharacterized protein n=1 Tax=Phytophthora rubi TaxID=129364 RepID=A0A6A3GIZ0_9STRA|nr:hypothetical protein PR002_g31473 [Phytophthora rubi]